MQHKPLIYVSRITSLSDARYCAGMGVDMLGFTIDPASPDFVSAPDYQAMVGWVSGPRRVVEIDGHLSADWLKIIEEYKPDLLHVTWTSVTTALPDLPLLLELPYKDLASHLTEIKALRDRIDHLILTSIPEIIEPSALQHLPPVLISIDENTGSWKDLLENTKSAGLALRGSRELTPGLKDYDHISNILEALQD